MRIIVVALDKRCQRFVANPGKRGAPAWAGAARDASEGRDGWRGGARPGAFLEKLRRFLACDPLSIYDVQLSLSLTGRVCWLLSLAILAAVGVAQMRAKGIAGMAPNERSSDATSEAIFASLTGEREASRRFVEELAALPERGALLILRPPNDVLTALPAYMAAYLAMPRPAVIRELRVADTGAVVEELRKNFVAVVFVGQKPPAAFPPGRKFGRSLALVPLVSSP